MSVENTDLERRVLAHEQILQALMAQLAEGRPGFLDRMRERFASARRGAHEHDYVETADYAEAFLRGVMRLGRVNRDATRGPPSGSRPATSAGPVIRGANSRVVIRSARSGGVWHVTRNGDFLGDYVSEGAARLAAESAGREIQLRGGLVDLRIEPSAKR
ncbi:MAG TPA: hypothetical protein VGH03_01530 [Caulobacteraceae bacterium]|jgi:hypothetical protein